MRSCSLKLFFKYDLLCSHLMLSIERSNIVVIRTCCACLSMKIWLQFLVTVPCRLMYIDVKCRAIMHSSWNCLQVFAYNSIFHELHASSVQLDWSFLIFSFKISCLPLFQCFLSSHKLLNFMNSKFSCYRCFGSFH